ncbi:MAG: hypothetical protein HKP58_03330 [Desulfatitalea sp.]|nr:hypothetical protein [Desulfatitalea sp.]NNJ99425.1 hypothetical protein [Desulfatitalea sp.]
MDSQKGKFSGIAAFFNESELKSLFLMFVQMIVVIEIILLLVMLTDYAINKSEPFPTKLYLFLAFGMPLAVIFLLGAMIHAFQHYVHGGGQSTDRHQEQARTMVPQAPNKTRHIQWHALRQANYLVKIALVLIAVISLFYLEDMILFLARAGGQALDSMVLIVIVLICGATLLGLCRALANFRLKNKQMDFQHQYRKDILERLELIVLDNETIVDKQGNIVPIKNQNLIDVPAITMGGKHIAQSEDSNAKTGTHEHK